MNQRRYLFCLIMTLFGFSQLHLRAENDVLADKVGAFAASLEASLAPSKPDTNTNANPPTRPHPETDSDQMNRSAGRILTQLRLLESAIRRNDFPKIQQISGSLGSYDMIPQLQSSWNSLSVEVTAAIEERIRRFDEQWYAEVRELAKDAHQTCLAANHSGDLDAILMRTAVIQMKQSQKDNVLTQRGRSMINGIAVSLRNWAAFLDQRDAGNRDSANEILHNFGRNGTEFPLLSVDEIRAKMLPAEIESTFKGRIDEILTGLKRLDDLPAVIDRWKSFQAAPQTAKGDMSQVVAMTAKLEILLKASNEMKAGNTVGSMTLANDSSLLSGSSDMIPYLKPLINQVAEGVLAAKIEKLFGPQPTFATNPGKAIDDALATLKKRGDYQILLELLSIQQNRAPKEVSVAISPIEHYLAAKRFESSGDMIMAISEYRSVVAAPAGPWLPQAEASEALLRLEKENADAFKDSNGVLLQEIRTLREQINQLRANRYYGTRNY